LPEGTALLPPALAPLPVVTEPASPVVSAATNPPAPRAHHVASSTPSRKSSRSSVSLTHSRVTAAERSDPAFLEALQLLSRARRALDRREPALALGLLDELDTRFARELLDEERAATRVFALCASDERAAALALARSWFVDRPRSIYTRRLEQSCAGEALR
jgi:hypothetical protein